MEMETQRHGQGVVCGVWESNCLFKAVEGAASGSVGFVDKALELVPEAD
jgi:hypothetical protein